MKIWPFSRSHMELPFVSSRTSACEPDIHVRGVSREHAFSAVVNENAGKLHASTVTIRTAPERDDLQRIELHPLAGVSVRPAMRQRLPVSPPATSPAASMRREH
jgi:hypothetical protein